LAASLAQGAAGNLVTWNFYMCNELSTLGCRSSELLKRSSTWLRSVSILAVRRNVKEGFQRSLRNGACFARRLRNASLDAAHLPIKCTGRGLQAQWEQFVKKCKDAGLSDAAIGAFKHNYDQLVAGATGLASSCEQGILDLDHVLSSVQTAAVHLLVHTMQFSW
jgi:hypothetical protein